MKADKTSTLALVVAAILLLVVGAMSYRDYINEKLEKEWAERNAPGQVAATAPAQAPAPAAPVAPATNPAAPAPVPAVAQTQTVPGAPPVPTAGVTAGSPLPQDLPSPWEGNPQLAAPVAPAPTPAAPPAPDPKLSQFQANLDAARQENALLQKKLEEARREAASPPPPASAVASVATPQVNPVNRLSTGPSATNPAATPSTQSGEQLSPEEMQKELAAMADQVRKAPALAKVIEYDAEWAILTINGGRDRNIEEDMKFAVRRGSEILGWAKVKFVEDSQAVAELMSPNKFSKTARKPEPGDDIIAFNLF